MDKLKAVDLQIENFKNNKYHNIDTGLKYIEKAIQICEENNFQDKLQECRYYYATGLFDKGRWKDSLAVNMDIKNIIEERGEKYVTKTQIYLTMGIHYYTNGNYEISLEYYLEALKEAEEKNELDNIVKIKTNISEIYKKLEDYETAKEYLDEILVYEDNINPQNLGIIYSNYGEILAEIEKFTLGLSYLEKSDEISKKIKDTIGLAYNEMIRGRIYKSQLNYIKSKRYYLESIKLFTKANDGVYIFEAYDDYIKLLIKINKLDEALERIEEVYELLDDKDSLMIKLNLEKSRAIVNYRRGEYKRSIDRYIGYDRILKRYNENILSTRLEALKVKFDIMKYQNEKKKIEKYNRELEQKKDVFETATEIIKEINSSLKLKDIVEKINRHLKNAIPLDVFGIALYDRINSEISFIEYIEGDKIHGSKIEPIEVNSRRHFVSYVVRNNEDIHLKTVNERSKYVDEIDVEPFNRISETLIMKRLVFEGELLGVLTVQSYKKDIYDSRHISIIDLITPYIAIAINNSIKSQDLIKEIKQRKKAEIKLKETNDILRRVSNTDNLTGLYNRHFLNKIMDDYFNENHIEGKKINLIMVDIDFFKEFNDTYGHIEGDRAIKKIGLKIKEICSNNTVNAFRYGGDEFLIIDYNLSKDDLRIIGKKINRRIEKLKIKNLKSPLSDYITVSVGITQVDVKIGCNQNKVIEKVDNALYESKRIGRNKVIFI